MPKSGFWVLAAAMCTVSATAQELDPEMTMRLISDPAAAVPAAVIELLALPESAAEIARTRSAEGLARADARRGAAADNRADAPSSTTGRPDFGLTASAAARERGAAFGAEVAEAAMSARENLVRGGGRMELPIPAELPQLPDHVPGRPENPGPPIELPDRPALPEQAGGA